MRNRLWVRALLAVVIAAATLTMLGLGFWQLGRLQQRRAENVLIRARLAAPPVNLNAELSPALEEYQPVQAAGVYDFSQEIVLRNRSHFEAPGVRVLTPLRLTGTDQAVLVDRGWLPYTESEPAARAAYHQPTGEVTVAGIVRPARTRQYSFLPADPTLSPAMPRVDAWFRVDIEQIQDQVPYPLLPFYIEAEAGTDPARLPLSGYEVDLSDGPHLSYALQWFGFAAILAVGSLALWRQNRRRAG